MIKTFHFIFIIIISVFTFSACNKEDDPAPKPQSYFEYSGKVYELKSANYSYFPDSDKDLFLEFSTLTKEEMQEQNEQGSFLKGSMIYLRIVTTVDREIVTGSYTLVNGQFGNGNLSAINFFIDMNGEFQTGILIFPVSGDMTINNTAEGKLVNFNFLASNGEKVAGRFQGDIVNIME